MEIQPTIIGKFCKLRDNSYAITLATGKNPYLALTHSLVHKGKERPILKIVSEPYVMNVESYGGIIERTFITVIHDDLLHVVLYHVDLVNDN